MKHLRRFILFVVAGLACLSASAQCSICTRTASQLGEDSGRGINVGVLYLAAAPMLIVGYIGFRWWRNNS